MWLKDINPPSYPFEHLTSDSWLLRLKDSKSKKIKMVLTVRVNDMIEVSSRKGERVVNAYVRCL